MMLSILSDILIALQVTLALFWRCLWGKATSSSVDKEPSFFHSSPSHGLCGILRLK